MKIIKYQYNIIHYGKWKLYQLSSLKILHNVLRFYEIKMCKINMKIRSYVG